MILGVSAERKMEDVPRSRTKQLRWIKGVLETIMSTSLFFVWLHRYLDLYVSFVVRLQHGSLPFLHLQSMRV